MSKGIDLARRMSKELDKNWLSDLEEVNLHKIFEPIFKINSNISDLNSIVVFIIYAYHPDSQWIDIRKDRYINKLTILTNLNCKTSSDLIQQVLTNSHDIVNDTILNFLNELTDWRWQHICTLIDYHSNMIRFANQKTDSEKSIDKVNKEGTIQTLTQDYDIDVVTKVNKQKGELLELALKARESADKLIGEIKKDFVATDVAVQADFGFSFTDTAKKKSDILSWRSYIKERNEKRVYPN